MKISPDLMYRFRASRESHDGGRSLKLTLRLQALDSDQNGYWFNVPGKDVVCSHHMTTPEIEAALDPQSLLRYHKLKIAEALAQEIVNSLDW
mgnify:CR=1 FL=1